MGGLLLVLAVLVWPPMWLLVARALVWGRPCGVAQVGVGPRLWGNRHVELRALPLGAALLGPPGEDGEPQPWPGVFFWGSHLPVLALAGLGSALWGGGHWEAMLAGWPGLAAAWSVAAARAAADPVGVWLVAGVLVEGVNVGLGLLQHGVTAALGEREG